MEIWKDVIWYEWKYKVSNLWKCFSVRNNKILKIQDNWVWYKFVRLSYKNKQEKKFIHRLVLESFIWKNILECNHKNWIKNDNRLENLEYCNRSQNILHRNNILWFKQLKWKNSICSKSVIQYSKEWNLIKMWDCIKDIERELNIFWTNVTRCCKWKVKSAGGYKWIYNLK